MPSSLPRWPASFDRSWDSLFQLFPDNLAAAAFPLLVQGRRPHWTFRGLLDVHWLLRPVGSPHGKTTRLSRRLRRFRYLHRRSDSYWLERPSCQVGIAPTEDQHLSTAHTSNDPPALFWRASHGMSVAIDIANPLRGLLNASTTTAVPGVIQNHGGDDGT